jgi:hypothetical protein
MVKRIPLPALASAGAVGSMAAGATPMQQTRNNHARLRRQDKRVLMTPKLSLLGSNPYGAA